MFEQQRLIPNLNDIIAEFADIVEKKNVEPMKTVTKEEIQEKNVEEEVGVEEGRKRKRGKEKDRNKAVEMKLNLS